MSTLEQTTPTGISPLDAVDALVERPAPPFKAGRYRRMAIGAIIAVVIFGYILYAYVPFAEIVEALTHAAPAWIALAAVITVSNRVLMTVKWWTLLRAQGVRTGLSSLTAIQFTSYFIGRAFPGSAGIDLVRAWIVTREQGRPAVIITSVLVDRVTNVVALALVSLFALLTPGIDVEGESLLIPGAVGVCVLFVIMLITAGPLDRWLSRWNMERWPRGCRVMNPVRRVLEAVNLYRRQPRVMAAAILWGLAVQVTRCLEVYILFLALGEGGLLFACLALVPVVMFVTQVPLGVSSLAVGAGAMVLLFNQFDVPSSLSLLASVLADAMCLAIIPVGAACYWLRGVPVIPKNSSASC